MCKVISVFQGNDITNRTGRNTAFPVKRTILDRYKVLADSCGGEIPPERLYKFLSGENARVMNRAKADGSLDDSTIEECREFADFYRKNVSRETRRKISNRIGGLPLFMREGVAALVPSTLPFPWNKPLELSNGQLVQVSSLMKFISGLENDAAATFCVLNPDGEPPMARSFAILKDAPEDEIKKSLVLTSIGYMVQFGGKLVLRERLQEKKSALMCFYAKDGILRPMSAEKLSADYDKNPKFSNEAKANTTFKTPAWP